MMTTVRTLASAIDHALLQPALTERDFDAGCELAKQWAVAAVCVKSADVRRARSRMSDSGVAISAVVGFPHANAPTEITCLEAQRSLENGASEIDAVVSLGPVLSSNWEMVADQIASLNATTTSHGGSLKVIFETGLIVERERKITLCRICREQRVAFVKTSTGFAIGHDTLGHPIALGATIDDVQLLVQNAGPVCKVKASGGIRSFDDAIRFLQAGAARLGTSNTSAILREASRRLL
jgi:deoxyribose-phosphate aldolase